MTTFPARPPAQRVRVIPLLVETLDNGQLRLSTPHARGWAATASNPFELARAIEKAYREVSCASYARQRGVAYDLDQLTMHTPGDQLAGSPMQRVREPRTRKRQSHHPADWSKFDDGSWKSPSGRTYRADSTTVKRVVARRQSLGLPI